ncbi:MAG: dipeptide ABC transporter ATP-binding protein [Spirochaetia bacterium]|nr:dipeptide ABC transporter ATP-binding protein [Spirochaetia bacterium]MCF7945517.1 dipeptide ABC transporter ATP-binding protein [Spirochaetia bacterium]
MSKQQDVILSVKNLKKHFPVKLGAFGERSGIVHAVDNVSLDIFRGETIGLVGESGCGKSTTGFTIVQLHKATAGQVIFNGTDLTKLDEKRLRPIRKHIQIVFQDPYSTLNPRMTVGETISEPLKAHKLFKKNEIKHKVAALLKDVGLRPALANRYPHEFSGGQRQRICIARALAIDPEFIVCDEPVSALDVSVQAQIINLMKELQKKYNLTYLFIAHDLAVVRHISDRIAVMYLGRIAELADKNDLFKNPLHPYTQALLSAVPEADPEYERQRKRIVLEGDVPDALNPPNGCRFHTRCPKAEQKCRTIVPELEEKKAGHFAACHFA